MKRSSYLVVGLVVAAVLVTSGCKLKVANKPPELKNFMFNPPSVMPGETVIAVVTASDKENDKFEIEYEWLVDGKPAPGKESTFKTTGLPSGAKVTVRFRVTEVSTSRSSDWVERTIELGAPPPPTLKSVSIQPFPVTAGVDAHAVLDYGEYSSADFTLFYKWTINGEKMEGDDFHEDTLSGRYLKKGDQVKVTVGDDEEFKGQNWDSATFTVIGHPPVFTTEPTTEIINGVLTVRYALEDPDGDDIKVTITGAPSGMTQDENGFTINLKSVPPGEYHVKISAVNETGAAVTSDVGFTVKGGGAAATAPEEPASEQPTETPAAEQPATPPETEPPQEQPAAGQPAETPETPAETPAEQPEAPAPAAGGSE